MKSRANIRTSLGRPPGPLLILGKGSFHVEEEKETEVEVEEEEEMAAKEEEEELACRMPKDDVGVILDGMRRAEVLAESVLVEKSRCEDCEAWERSSQNVQDLCTRRCDVLVEAMVACLYPACCLYDECGTVVEVRTK
uniref:Uncharacterized protein n=1 Tax=Melanopsichium pennsylvanicum 4 TaxID=1398559 RepID=A0A077QXU7_9BASI|nr:uncharacterized protein BN887_06020 [Melanopsichium pennsylvanicum 4]